MFSWPFVHKISPLPDVPVLVLAAMGARDSILPRCVHDSAPLKQRYSKEKNERERNEKKNESIGSKHVIRTQIKQEKTTHRKPVRIQRRS